MAPTNKRKPSKKPTRKSQVGKRNQPKKGFPFLAVFAAALLVGFISYFVFSVDKPAPQAVTHKPAQKKEEQLPEKPESKWEYEDTLKTKKVEVDIPVETKKTRPYQMQCGSFRKQTDAESLKARIAFQGLTSIVKKTGSWYRVILGPYNRKRMAENDRHKLQRAKINGCQIWYWR